MPGMTWNAETHQKLLLAIIDSQKIHVDFDAVAQKLGPNCTACAVQMQLKKLRKIAKNGGGGPLTSSKDSSPTKPKAKITKAKATNKKRKLKEIVDDDEEEEATDLEDLKPMKVDSEPIKAEV